MEITINPQKILRTGDTIINKKTGKKGIIHYVCERSGQYTFERVVSELGSVLFDTGKNIIELPIKYIDLP